MVVVHNWGNSSVSAAWLHFGGLIKAKDFPKDPWVELSNGERTRPGNWFDFRMFERWCVHAFLLSVSFAIRNSFLLVCHILYHLASKDFAFLRMCLQNMVYAPVSNAVQFEHLEHLEPPISKRFVFVTLFLLSCLIVRDILYPINVLLTIILSLYPIISHCQRYIISH